MNIPEEALVVLIQNAKDWIERNHGSEYLEQFQNMKRDELAKELLDYLKTCYEDQYIDTYLVYNAPRSGDDPELDRVTKDLEEVIAKTPL
jgi:uncharacterized protein YeeX (DUF496 family)